MKQQYVERLLQCHEDLCHDIVFDDISALLVQNQVISMKEYQMIVNQPQECQVETLLETLPEKDDVVFTSFINTLQRDYDWLAKKLEGRQEVNCEDETDNNTKTVIPSQSEIKNLSNWKTEATRVIKFNNMKRKITVSGSIKEEGCNTKRRFFQINGKKLHGQLLSLPSPESDARIATKVKRKFAFLSMCCFKHYEKEKC